MFPQYDSARIGLINTLEYEWSVARRQVSGEDKSTSVQMTSCKNPKMHQTHIPQCTIVKWSMVHIFITK